MSKAAVALDIARGSEHTVLRANPDGAVGLTDSQAPLALDRHPAPTQTEVIALAQRLRAFYATEDLELMMDRMLREQSEPINMPVELMRVKSEFHDATATDEHARVLAAISHARPTLSVVPGETDQSQDNAELREHATEQLIFDACDRVDGLDVWTAVCDACLEGGAWLKVVLDYEQWADVYHLRQDDFENDPGYPDQPGSRSRARKFLDRREAAKRQSHPISLVCPDSVSIYPLWIGNMIAEVIEHTRRPALTMMNLYHLGFDPKRGFYNKLGAPLEPRDVRSLGATVDYYEHWTDTWVTRFVFGGGFGMILEQQRHGMGRHPYFFAPGLMSNYWRQRKVGWGVTKSKQQLIRMKNFIMSLIQQEAAQQVGAPIIHLGGSQAKAIVGGTGVPRGAEERFGFNQILNWSREDKVEEFPLKQVTPHLIELLKTYSEEIEKITSPRFNGEIAGSSVQGAGFAISTILTNDQLKHAPFVDSLRRMLKKLTAFIWYLISHVIGENVYVNHAAEQSGANVSKWLTLGPDDVRDAVVFSWDINIKQASQDMILERTWAERVKNGSASMDMAIEALGSNPSEVRRGREMDRIRQTDWYLMAVDRKVMQGMLRGDLKQKAAEQLAATGKMPAGTSTQGASPLVPNPTPRAAPGSTAVGPPPNAGMVPDTAALASAPHGGGPAAATPVQVTPGGTPGMPQPGQLAARQMATAGAMPTFG